MTTRTFLCGLVAFLAGVAFNVYFGTELVGGLVTLVVMLILLGVSNDY